MFYPMFASRSFLSPLVKSLAPSAKWLTGNKGEPSQKEQKRVAELRRIGDVFGPPLDLVRYYVEPHCQHHNPADHAEDRQPVSAVRSPAFATVNEFLKGDYPLLADGSRHLFVLSDAGMGKTSLLMMIRLMHLFAFWPKGYGCLLLKLGPDTLETVAAHPDKANTVLLLDALDEDPEAWGNIEQRLLAILGATTGYRRVILSCRTQFFPETGSDPFGLPGRVRVGHYTCPMVFLSLFNEEQVRRYLVKRFPNRLHLFPNPKRQRAERLVLGMRTLRFRPLLLAYIDHILDADRAGTRDWNPYTLYEALIESWLDREEGKLCRQLENPPNREKLWEICAAVAVALQQEGKRELSRAELDGLVEGFPEVRDIEYFDVGGRSLLNRNANGDFRFSHYSIQEFLVVRGLLGKQAGIWAKALGDIRLTEQLREFLLMSGEGRDSALWAWLHPDEYMMDFSSLEEVVRREQPMSGFHFYDVLSDGSRGPLMQWIPAGEFLMGSPEDERERDSDEGPQHEVRIAVPFVLGTYPVTFAEYDRFCAATGRRKPRDEGWGREQRPVISVSWQDAEEYCDWLSQETGQRYRLPSEAEWEYAARAGTQTRYWWGDDINANRANCDGCSSQWDTKQTSPVDSFAPNPFGLFDIAGNVWEWTVDCWHDDYTGAPVDGSAWGKENGGDGSQRVVRGGSWGNGPTRLRSAFRFRYGIDNADSFLGFRIARAL